MTAAEGDKTSVAYKSAEDAHTRATAAAAAKAKALEDANALVGTLKAKQTVLTKWVALGEAYLKNTQQEHQIKWYKNNMAGQRLYSSALDIQKANAKKIAEAAAAKLTPAEIKQLNAFKKAGAAVLKDTDNLNKWHTNKLDDATTEASVSAMVTADKDNAVWVKADNLKLTAVTKAANT